MSVNQEEYTLNFFDEFYYQIASGREIEYSYQQGYRSIQAEEKLDKSTLLKLFNREGEIERRELENQLSSCLKEIEKDPYNAKLWEKKGNFLEKLGRFSEVNEAYKKASLLNPQDYKIWWNNAKSHVRVGENGEAVECYRKALDLLPPSPDDYVICREYGAILDKLGQFYEGILLYNTSLSLQPNYRVASHYKKQAYKKIYSKEI